MIVERTVLREDQAIVRACSYWKNNLLQSLQFEGQAAVKTCSYLNDDVDIMGKMLS